MAYLGLLCCLLVAGSAAPSVQSPGPVPDSTERDEQESGWSDPRRLWPEAGHPLFNPSLAVTDTAVFVAGNGDRDPEKRVGENSLPDSINEVFDDTTRLRIRQIGGPELSVPPGNYEMTHPFFGVTPGGLHLIWCEPDPDKLRKKRAGKNVGFLYTRVYHSRHADGHWTPPESAIPLGRDESGRAEYFHIPVDGRGTLLAGPKGTLHLIVGRHTNPEKHGVLYSRWVPGQEAWREQSLPEFSKIKHGIRRGVSIGTIADVAVRPSGDVHLATVSAISGNPNSVLTARWPAERAEWTNQKVLWYSNDPESDRFGADGQGVNDLTLLSDSSGTLYLLREQSLDQGISPEAARLVVSRDGGRSWSEPFDFPLSDHFGGGFFGVLSHHAVVAPSGRLHAVFLGSGAGSDALYHAKWSATEGWGEPLRVNNPETTLWRPDLAVGPDGEQLHLVYTRRVDGGPPEAVHRTFPLR